MNEDWAKIQHRCDNLREFIDRTIGPSARYYKKESPKRKLDFRRKQNKQLRQNILLQIYPDVLVLADMRMDPRVECICLLNETRKPWLDKSARDFIAALADALQVSPPPKWWRVWRKVVGNVPASQFAYPKETNNAKRLTPNAQ